MSATPPSSLSPCQLRDTVRRPPSSFFTTSEGGEEYHRDSLIHAMSLGLRRSRDDTLSKSPRETSLLGSTLPFPLQYYNDIREDRYRSSAEQRRNDMTRILDAALNIANEVSLDLQSLTPPGSSYTSSSSIDTTMDENDDESVTTRQ